jgi:cytochrome-b5 reductase
MTNRAQVLFVVSFFSVFAALVLISNYIGSKLRAAGYDVSRIILIGLETNSSSSSTAKFAIPWSLHPNMTTIFDINDFQEKGYAQVVALILALLSSIFIYLKFGTSKYTPFG